MNGNYDEVAHSLLPVKGALHSMHMAGVRT